MRVLQILRPGTGGAARHVEILVRLLSARGLEITVVASPLEDPTFLDRLKEAGANRVVPIPIERPPALSDVGAFVRLLRILARERWDVVHCHTAKPGLLGRLGAALVGVRRVVYTPHGFYFNYPMGRTRQRFHLALERLLAPLTDRMILVSPQEGRQVERLRLAPRSRTVVVPNCVELPAEDRGESPDPQQVREALGLDPHLPIVAWVGRLDPPKDPVTAIRAMARLRQRGIPAQLAIAGAGSQMETCRRAIEEAGVADRVHLLGHLDGVGPLLGVSELVTLTSGWEGLPYSLLEAAAAARPVVATDIPGCRNACRDGESGLLVPPGRPDDLADALATLLDDPQRAAAMGRQGREWVAREFGPEPWADRILSIYGD